jgi:WhiB family redox-sensing transcriptional regulator
VTWTPNWDWNAKDWRRRGACRDSDPDLFFPIGATGDAIGHAEAAKAVCRQCSVRVDCLEFAMTSNQDSGVWGGATEDERRRMRRSWREGDLVHRQSVTARSAWSGTQPQPRRTSDE